MEEWLLGHPLADSSAIANRAVMRALPNFITQVKPPRLNNLTAVALQILRSCITAQAEGADIDLSEAVRSMRSSAGWANAWENPLQDAVISAAISAIGNLSPAKAAEAGEYAAKSYARDFEAGSYGTQNSRVADYPSKERETFWSAVQADAIASAAGKDIDRLPLWHDEVSSGHASPDLFKSLGALPGGAFWTEWYQGVLDGQSQSPELLRDLATIDGALWAESDTELDAEIVRTLDRHVLLAEVRSLKEQLAAVMRDNDAGFAGTESAPMGIGHNSGSTQFEESCSVASDLADALEEAETELLSGTPQPSRLKRIGQALKRIEEAIKAGAWEVGSYCAQRGDEFVKSMASEAGKSVGKWTGRSVAAYLVASSEGIRLLSEAVSNLADKF